MELFLTPNGRISQSTYWRGVIILAAISIVLTVLSAYVTPMVGILALLFVWPWIAIHVKRLHDNGKTGWLTIAVVVAAIIVSFILAAVVSPLLGGGVANMEAEINAAAQTGDINAIMEMSRDMQKAQLIPGIVQTALMTGIIGFGMSLLKTEPADNQYGPVPAA
jgi:uncharacterized membrane protein YhaH (DUF805 family)